ncbi:amino acid permease, partial [Neobacillus citreus]
MKSFMRKKSINELQQEGTNSTGLQRILGLWQLTAIGLGGIIGVGIFVLTGVAAAEHAGPAVILSFMIAGLASAAAALCYAEFAGLIPVAGSAYTYSYAVLGEGAAWLIGWDLLLEYTLVIAVVAIGWSGYMQEILQQIGIHVPVWAQGAPGTGAGHKVDLIAM